MTRVLNAENINEILEGLKNLRETPTKIILKNFMYNIRIDIADDNAKKQLESHLKNKTVVIIAPGSSINEEKEKIYNVISSENHLTIAINFKPEKFECDYVFVSNLRRYEDLKNNDDLQLIKTSNIKNGNVEGIVVNYSDLLNDVEAVEDNAGMMLIKLLIDIGVKKIKLAGLDGYSHDIYDNFAKKDLAFIKNATVMDAMNLGMAKMLNRFAEVIDIEFITTPRFIKLGESQ